MAFESEISIDDQNATRSFSGGLSFEENNNRIIGRDANSIPRLNILADGVNFDMKVSKPGFDVLTATNDQLIFNSAQNMFKIIDTKIVPLDIVLTGPGPYTQIVQVPHGLKFTPAYSAYITIDPVMAGITSGITNNGPNPFLVSAANSTNIVTFVLCQVGVDSTNINFTVYSAFGGTGSTLHFSAKVYLFQETAN